MPGIASGQGLAFRPGPGTMRRAFVRFALNGDAMGHSLTFVSEGTEVHVPAWVEDLDSFRRWVDTDEFPDEGRIDYLPGKVWIDMSREQAFSHNQVKTEITIVVGGLVRAENLGLFFSDGMRLTCVTI